MKIGVVGAGGRTGSMFAFELKKVGFDVFGIAKKEEKELIDLKKVFVKRNESLELFEVQTIADFEFPKETPEILFFAVKNPVRQVIEFYFKKIKEKNLKPPAIFLSQNGMEAFEETVSILREIFGKESENIDILRIILFNAIDRKVFQEKIEIFYTLPIKIALAKPAGKEEIGKFLKIFQNKNFKILRVEKNFKNIECSKLFLNLMGMSSASYGLSIKEGFFQKKIFEEEILAQKEYIKVIKIAKLKFLNFPGYPIKLLAFFIEKLPVSFLFFFRKLLGFFLIKGRGGKEKELEEIDYYNGAVVRLAEKLGFEAKVHRTILERGKNLLKSSYGLERV